MLEAGDKREEVGEPSHSERPLAPFLRPLLPPPELRTASVVANRFVVSAVADHARLSTSVCVIVAKLTKFRVQAATRSNEMMPTMLEGTVVFVAVQAKPAVFSEGISAR